jgi:hypothetical protein
MGAKGYIKYIFIFIIISFALNILCIWTFYFELSLLLEKGLLSLSSVTKYRNGATKYSNADPHSSALNTKLCAQMKSLERDLIPRPFPYQVLVTYDYLYLY